MSSKIQNPTEKTETPATEGAKITGTPPKKDELNENQLDEVSGGIRHPPIAE